MKSFLQNYSMHFAAISIIYCVVLVAPGYKIDPQNPPIGQTGAPSELTCSTTNGCHYNGSFNGTVLLTGLPDTIVKETTYNITLKLSSTCVRTGFEMTVLDKANNKCGDLIAGTNSNLKTSSGRQYIRQSTPANLALGTASYTFKWKSPTSILNDSAFFYFVMLQANGNGNSSGDNVVKGTKSVVMPKLSAVGDVLVENDIKIYPNPCADFLNLELENPEKIQVYMTNGSGKQIANFRAIDHKVLDTKALSNGIYYLNFKDKSGKSITKKFSVLH